MILCGKSQGLSSWCSILLPVSTSVDSCGAGGRVGCRDIDVKRLEPYFQLSKPERVTASNSISLHYTFV